MPYTYTRARAITLDLLGDKEFLMEGPFGINVGPADFKTRLVALSAVLFPILLTLVLLVIFGRL